MIGADAGPTARRKEWAKSHGAAACSRAEGAWAGKLRGACFLAGRGSTAELRGLSRPRRGFRPPRPRDRADDRDGRAGEWGARSSSRLWGGAGRGARRGREVLQAPTMAAAWPMMCAAGGVGQPAITFEGIAPDEL